MGRGGQPKDRSQGPERKCIATGEVRPTSGLIRFVVGPEGQIVPDVAGKLPGRGIWVSADRAALEKAAGKGLFARAAKQAVTVPEGLTGQVETMLARRVVDLISLARKGGGAVAGYEKVKNWVSMEDTVALIQASDGSERGKSKLSTPHGGRFIGWLTSDELGQAFGRQTVIHAALRAGGLAKLLDDQLGGVCIDGLVLCDHHAVVHQRLDDLADLFGHAVGQLADHDRLGHLHVADDLFALLRATHRLLTCALLLALHGGHGFLTATLARKRLIQRQLARAAAIIAALAA